MLPQVERGDFTKGWWLSWGRGFRESLEGWLPGRAQEDVFRSMGQRSRGWQLDCASIPSVCF